MNQQDGVAAKPVALYVKRARAHRHAKQISVDFSVPRLSQTVPGRMSWRAKSAMRARSLPVELARKECHARALTSGCLRNLDTASFRPSALWASTR
jgi:hypothetical protein